MKQSGSFGNASCHPLTHGMGQAYIRDMPLEIELKTFEKLKPQLLADEGKFAVISGEELLGIYSSYDDALKIGYEKCKLQPFLVKKILGMEPVNFFSRTLTPCPT